MSSWGAKADVAIHCGDLTEHSTIQELRTTLQLLKEIDAPVTLVIAGNHDFTLDADAFRAKLAEADRIAGETLDRSLVMETFRKLGAARGLLQSASEDHGILFLDEATHRILLLNGAQLSIYASLYTPSNGGDWGY
ncbi:ser/Thr protein phosphatase family protein [Metarhizium rileyi]|uniref:Ser/Thr protein phosphatase family protein n=1 Tax=Metarhizium rileyi (strain RCEF 4871) TaxID=1649241 RepID=A0A166X868_METRR|nr:ser/Thr protein phosphatase family protein [Metarhizium rileyi RCEF 4871]